jgi:RNA polymerase sigma factor (sigma-70 family)
MDHSEPASSHEAVLEHVAWMRQLAYELVRDAGAADDLVQETWLAFLRARPDTDRPLRPWLSRVVRNAAALRLRRGASRVARESDAASSELLPSAHHLVERAEEQHRLSESVLALDEPYRAVILLRYYEGLTPQQIAKARGVPGATVRSQLHRGLAKLRERLDREHGGDRKAWVMMLQPLWSEADAAATAGASSGVLIGAGIVATALLWFGVSWALQDDRAVTLEPEVADAELPNGGSLPARSLDNSRVVVAPDSMNAAAGEREWRLIDDRTGEPLASYVLRVDGEDRRSDAEGRVNLPANARSVVPIDDVGLAHDYVAGHRRLRGRRAVEREPVSLPESAASADLQLSAGPTFQLRLAPASAVDPNELTARLVCDNSNRALWTPQPVQVAPVRTFESAGGAAWVRFAGLPNGWDDPDRDWLLEVRDREGFWQGLAKLATVSPDSNSTLVDVELLQTGVVRGRIGGLPADQLPKTRADLYFPREYGFTAEWAAGGRLDAHGDYTLRWLSAGAYSLAVRAPIQETWSEEVFVHAGEITLLDHAFEDLAPAGPVAGSIYSQSGRYQGQLLVYLLDNSDFVIDVFPTTWRHDADGVLVANFRFDHAPPGRLKLDVLSLQDSVTFDYDFWGGRAPREDVSVTLLDEEPAEDWAFEVSDAETGAAITEYTVEFHRHPLARQFRATPLPDASSGEPDHRLLWTMSAGGLR